MVTRSGHALWSKVVWKCISVTQGSCLYSQLVLSGLKGCLGIVGRWIGCTKCGVWVFSPGYHWEVNSLLGGRRTWEECSEVAYVQWKLSWEYTIHVSVLVCNMKFGTMIGWVLSIPMEFKSHIFEGWHDHGYTPLMQSRALQNSSNTELQSSLPF